MNWEISIIQAVTPEEFASAGRFILDYSKEFKESLSFQNIEQEVEQLANLYQPPHARLFLLKVGNEAAGCVIVQRLTDDAVEMKRMYIDPKHRGKGYSQAMIDMAIAAARSMGAQRILLDTDSSMQSAIHIYEKNGFKPIPPYYHSPLPHAMFFELVL